MGPDLISGGGGGGGGESRRAEIIFSTHSNVSIYLPCSVCQPQLLRGPASNPMIAVLETPVLSK